LCLTLEKKQNTINNDDIPYVIAMALSDLGIPASMADENVYMDI
jgi:hypothetical protein